MAVVAGSLALLLVLCGGGFLAYQAIGGQGDQVTPSPSKPGAAKPAPTPSAPAPEPTLDLSARTSDPRPLTAAELFGATSVKGTGGATYTKLKTEVSPSCTVATTGTATKLVAGSKCTQVVRATYVDNTRKYVATVGAANLPDAQSATLIGRKIFLDRQKGFWTPLRVPGTAAAGFNNVSDRVITCSGLVGTHYIVWTIVAKVDKSKTTEKDKAAVQMALGLRADISKKITGRQ